MIRIIPFALLTAASSLTWAFQSQSGQNPPQGQNPQGQSGQNQPGQNPRSEPGQTGQDTRGMNPDAKKTDDLLASWLVIGSNNEMALAELALQRSTNPDVKAFAQKMIDEHRQFGQKLQTFASVPTVARGGHQPVKPREEGGLENPRDETRPREGGFDPQDDPTRRQPASARIGEFDHLGLIQELGDQCKQSSRKELESKQGADFDRCYVGMAIGHHMGTNDMMTVFQRHASGSLKPVLSEGQRVVTSHLQEAKDLAKKLEEKKSYSPTGGK